MNDYTIVLGVDKAHLEKLGMVWATWKRHKPSLLKRPLIIFYDHTQVKEYHIRERVDHPDYGLVAWPPQDVTYEGDESSKWFHPQRMKMLAGFVHVPGLMIETKYWLKLDLDVVATGGDKWIDNTWFVRDPAIVAHRWGFTKPANQMLELDAWAAKHADRMSILSRTSPLNLQPLPGWERIKHPRIISWCGFFSTALTRLASTLAMNTVGEGQLPVPSQDGYLWYLAERLGLPIVRTDMKSRGWEWWSTYKNVSAAVKRSIGEVPWYPVS